MNKKLTSSIAAGLLSAGFLGAEGGFSLPPLSLSSSLSFKTEDVEHGHKQGQQVFTPSVRIGVSPLEGLELYFWNKNWLGAKKSVYNRHEFSLGASYDVTEVFTVDFGFRARLWRNVREHYDQALQDIDQAIRAVQTSRIANFDEMNLIFERFENIIGLSVTQADSLRARALGRLTQGTTATSSSAATPSSTPVPPAGSGAPETGSGAPATGSGAPATGSATGTHTPDATESATGTHTSDATESATGTHTSDATESATGTHTSDATESATGTHTPDAVITADAALDPALESILDDTLGAMLDDLVAPGGTPLGRLFGTENMKDAKSMGIKRRGYEIYLGMTANGLLDHPLDLSLYYTHGFTEKRHNVEAKADYLLDLSSFGANGFSIDVVAVLGWDKKTRPWGMKKAVAQQLLWDQGAKKSSVYWTLGTALVYEINSNSAAKIGVEYQGLAKKKSWPHEKHRNHIWFTTSFEYSF